MVGWKSRVPVIIILCVLLMSVLSLLPAGEVFADGPQKAPLDIQARSYVLMEMETGQVLAGKGEKRPYPPASLTKIMTEYLVLEEVKSGRIRWNDPVKISENAASIGEAQVNLVAGEKRTVEELFHAMAIHSANDAAVALAEYISGSERAFVGKMNKEAKRLGLKETHFINCTGLPRHSYPDPPQVKGEHRMSAKDIARLTRHLLRDHPQVIQTISLPEYIFRQGEKRELILPNSNRMLPGLSHFYDGVDGVKTGYTREAGYTFTGTAKRDDMRLITVVMGTDSKSRRFIETKKLLDFGFQNYRMKPLLKKGKSVPSHSKVALHGGVETEVPVVAAASRALPVRNGEKAPYTLRVDFKSGLEAPIRSGDVVGTARIQLKGKDVPGVPPVPLKAGKDVERAGWWTLFFRSVTEWFR
ncbi:D-alanyl-D-alanine carboxypeptidase [Kroppenstedtia guangzhouensis]|uniref:serine-type D-Ala-D-Ala carboxypeptidase n=1 Tax=Kroppenstedtia guangzhouensis TaxID=1274356 RepID=A0ABQ1GME0_9BACL|nr:D-alanyl-D-alanine carboxypeptidase family protein [Kroppenstedtia guangzhouensis]GGA46749.1 D-alanyl-D-alanine carboxypeptidase [Kroppenstedtia guangzhouensis]